MKKKPDAKQYEDKLNHLKSLVLLRQAGYIELFFADESGFSLTPSVPYGWQPVGEQYSITTERKHALNVFGLLDPIEKKIHTYATSKNEKVNTEFMIRSIEDFLKYCQKLTVIILDNAPWHTS